MKIVIVGGGKVGEALCIDLATENHDVVVIDTDAQVVDRLIGLTDISGVVGSGASLELLREAGVPGCDVFIAVTASDEINIISSIIARKLGAKAALARVRNPEYSSNLDFIQENLGITMLVNPEFEAARAIALSVRFPSALGIETFANGRVQLGGGRFATGSPLAGMALSHFRETHGTVLVCVVQRGDEVHIPEGSFVLREGDLLYVTGSIGDLTAIYKIAGCFTRKVRSITRYLLRLTARSGLDICVIDRSESITEALAGDFPKIKVITADGTDQAVLEEHHIGSYDCFVALTGIDEENLLTSLYAAKQNVPKIVTKVNRTQLLRIIGDIKAQTVVTPKRLVSDKIIRFVRAMNDSLESKVEAMYRMVDGRVEALQFEVLKSSRATGIPLKNLTLKKNILIAYIVRGNQLIFPTGDDEILPGDHLIAVTTEHDFDEVDDLLLDEARK